MKIVVMATLMAALPANAQYGAKGGECGDRQSRKPPAQMLDEALIHFQIVGRSFKTLRPNEGFYLRQ